MLLKNELQRASDFLCQMQYGDHKPYSPAACSVEGGESFFEELCKEARDAWASALFSEHAEESLRRYYTYHLRSIGNLRTADAGMAYHPWISKSLLDLTRHLITCYGNKIAGEETVPVLFMKDEEKLFDLKLQQVCGLLEDRRIEKKLACTLTTTLSGVCAQMSEKNVSLQLYGYVVFLIRELIQFLEKPGNTGNTEGLNSLLLAANYNHLGYLKYLQDNIRDNIADLEDSAKIAELKRQGVMIPQGFTPTMTFDLQWPAITTMFKTWLSEEAAYLSNRQTTPVTERVGLNISVAQLACLIRYFYEAGGYATTNLTHIFKSAVTHFSAKRQAVISPGSLGNRYYNIDQKTAAEVRGLLQEMLAGINRNFFPVLLVASLVFRS